MQLVRYTNASSSDTVSLRGATLTDLLASFAGVAPDALPDQVIEAIQSHPNQAHKIAAAAVRAIAGSPLVADAAKCAAVEQIVVSAIRANREAAVDIARKSFQAAPQFNNCILSAATSAAGDLRLAFERAERQAAIMRALAERVASEQDLRSGDGMVNPASTQGRDDDNVQSPEQPPNNNPPNNPPNGNPPNGRPPHNPPPHGNHPQHNLRPNNQP